MATKLYTIFDPVSLLVKEAVFSETKPENSTEKLVNENWAKPKYKPSDDTLFNSATTAEQQAYDLAKKAAEMRLRALELYANTVTITKAGEAVFFLTSDKTENGLPLYASIDAVLPAVNDVSKVYSFGWAISADLKKLTVSVKVSSGLVVQALGLTLLGGSVNAPVNTAVSVFVKGI